MKLAVLKERLDGEARVAASPETVKKLVALGFDVVIERGAGEASSLADDLYEEAGASVLDGQVKVCDRAQIILKVRRPSKIVGDDLSVYSEENILIANLGALDGQTALVELARTGVTAFGLELMPRITRAQSMDILSSQSNLAGYKSVLDAASHLGRAFPMMMTAAGTIPPAKVFIMGVGVAGLQAIATAKRLGAVVTATDVRPATKEQVESLGAKFLEVDPEIEKDSQTDGGYAKQMPEEYLDKQRSLVNEHIKKQDVVITTALIPGRAAPVLVTRGMVESMPAGAVIVDLAAELGGNCELSEIGKIVKHKDITIIGHENMSSRIPEDASQLFSKNILNFIIPLVDAEAKSLKIDWDDEILQGTAVCKSGHLIHPLVIEKRGN